MLQSFFFHEAKHRWWVGKGKKKTMDGVRHLKRFQHQVSPIGKKCMDVRKSWRDIWQKKKTPDVERGKYKIVERIVWWGRINSGSNAYMGGGNKAIMEEQSGLPTWELGHPTRNLFLFQSTVSTIRCQFGVVIISYLSICFCIYTKTVTLSKIKRLFACI